MNRFIVLSRKTHIVRLGYKKRKRNYQREAAGRRKSEWGDNLSG